MPVLSWAKTHISAAHRSIEGGPIHGHTWYVKAYWDAAGGYDALILKEWLVSACYQLDHVELPKDLSRAESIVAFVADHLDCFGQPAPLKVEVWREAEAVGAEWTP